MQPNQLLKSCPICFENKVLYKLSCNVKHYLCADCWAKIKLQKLILCPHCRCDLSEKNIQDFEVADPDDISKVSDVAKDKIIPEPVKQSPEQAKSHLKKYKKRIKTLEKQNELQKTETLRRLQEEKLQLNKARSKYKKFKYYSFMCVIVLIIFFYFIIWLMLEFVVDKDAGLCSWAFSLTQCSVYSLIYVLFPAAFLCLVQIGVIILL
jgi:hypothetical protein